ncbi:GntR family transcriptional regulator [Cytobacillus sp. FSL H8-0458]|uniref:GntR family transcriptional regulator n=1 Tax=Cytobacillus sp. FSL H8-0458 TaxID=2975346 RepID=UPI0030F8E220
MKPLQNDSVIPLYHQLKERLKQSIDNGLWKTGDQIPSENQLMKEYKVSRNTAKKAIEELVQEGLLYRIQGKGTFVTKPKLEQSLMGLYSFSKVFKEKGMEPKDIILEVREISPTQEILKELQLTKDEKVIEMRRLRCVDDEPVILESSYFSKEIVSNLHVFERVGKISLYDLLEQEFNVFVTKAKEAFEPVLIRKDESEYLQTEAGKPALLLERTAYDANGQPVEFCRSIIRGDRCRFYTELT